ncbi:hypothetical protein K505DRAFT_320285 [Melanomma pulvis-pyrius CBS 109.77]|uniref:Secreted protein n=1 Tax=Melanomma pulvis-pyrius CBS 109.77 TaxID=1314802 RepID=A0A6A6XW28_9PLEO|nr:hypothetical protein K505DRAFT_320285 [Melanomma pulvis-pyrius CBS 109.77]
MPWLICLPLWLSVTLISSLNIGADTEFERFLPIPGSPTVHFRITKHQKALVCSCLYIPSIRLLGNSGGLVSMDKIGALMRCVNNVTWQGAGGFTPIFFSTLALVV